MKRNERELRRPRAFGNCWLGCELWRQLGLEAFWQEKLSSEVQRETVPWEKGLRLLVVNRLLEPGSEFRLHRHWFDQSARAELPDADFAVAEKDRLYRCLDRILEHKQALFAHLRHSSMFCSTIWPAPRSKGKGHRFRKPSMATAGTGGSIVSK